MDIKESKFFPYNQRRGTGEVPWKRDPYPSSFYSSKADKEPHDESPLKKEKNRGIGPLILPPPPITSREIVKRTENELQDNKKKLKKIEEIIPPPEDDDEYFYEKEVGAVSPEIDDIDEYDLLKEEEDGEKQEEHEKSDTGSADSDKVFQQEETLQECKENDLHPHKLEEELPKFIKARLPVLLIKEELEIDIFDSFSLMKPLTDLSKVEWNVHEFKGWALPHSNKIFLELVLTADIDFVSERGGNLQSLKMFVPLQKTISVHWRSSPDIPYTNRGEYDFKEKDGFSPSTHRVWEEKLVQPITFNLQSFQLIWHDELLKEKEGKSSLGVQGTAKISIEASQNQVVTIKI
ncbi:MAG: hypothetical protein ACQEUT_19040 [Bacillota bacterium]